MPEPTTVRLMARTDLPSAEIVVLDGNFQFVHSAVGSVDVALPPGVYTVQYRAGSAVTDVPVVLRPGSGEVRVPEPLLRMKSPAPFDGNEAGTLYGQRARESSLNVHAHIGKGSELFVFLRAATREGSGTADLQVCRFDVAVLNAHREQIAHLRDSPEYSADGLSVGYNLELDPGTYILRFDSGGGNLLEQSVVVSEGLQTQVFASSRRYGAERNVVGPNLPEAAVFMVRRGVGFDPSDSGEQQWTESARQALAQGGASAPTQYLTTAVQQARLMRESIPPEQLDEMLKAKFVKPMLGIYGAHLLLKAPEPDWLLLREVITNLKRIVGDHPDVTALTLLPELRDIAGKETYSVPPMLRNSWNLIVANSTKYPDLVPVGSLFEAVADRMWGSGAWLVWRSPATAPPERAALPSAAQNAEHASIDFDQAIAAIHNYVLQQLRGTSLPRFVEQVARKLNLTDTERAVIIYIAMTQTHSTALLDAIRSNSGLFNRALVFLQSALARTKFLTRARDLVESDTAVQAELSEERLVRALGVPASALNRAIIWLAQKLTAQQ